MYQPGNLEHSQPSHSGAAFLYPPPVYTQGVILYPGPSGKYPLPADTPGLPEVGAGAANLPLRVCSGWRKGGCLHDEPALRQRPAAPEAQSPAPGDGRRMRHLSRAFRADSL
nr:MAG TPA: hypothetical protein [Caudoviricetes sp.]